MKRIISVLLALVIISGSLTVSFSAFADFEDDVVFDYAFFDFNKGDVVSHTVNSGTSTDSQNNVFYPFLSKDSGASLSQEDITVIDGNEQKTVSTLKIEANNYSNIIFTDKDGKPFEARPNVKYTVRVKAYIKYFGRWSQYFYGFGFSGHESAGYKNANESIVYVDHRQGDTFKSANAMYAKFGSGSVYYNGVKDRYNETFDTSAAGFYYDGTYTYVLSNQNGEGDPFVAHDESGNEYAVNNYFGAFLSMATVTLEDGSKKKSTVYIDSIEIYSEDTAALVTMYDGETKIGENYMAMGSALPDAPQKDGFNFEGWYLDPDFKTKASDTVDTVNLSLYALYIDPNAPIKINYFMGDEVIKTESLRPGEALWDGGGLDDYYFAGWYNDKELKSAYNGLVAAEETNLYGKFVPYKDNYTANSFTYRERVKVYYTYNGAIYDSFDGTGWNWAGLTADKKLISRNNRTWGQSGTYIINDVETGEVFVPQPGATYEITVKYTLTSLDAKSVTVSLGYGVKKEFSADITDKTPVSYKNLASHTSTDDVGKEYTVSHTIVVPESPDADTISCLTIYTLYSGRRDENNATPLSQIEVSEISVQRKNTDSIISFDGASILKSEVSARENTQAMRVYFGYTLNENGKIVIEGEEKEIVARGILLKNADNKASLDVNTSIAKGVFNFFNTDLESCWNYNEESGRVTFSAYISGFKENDERNVSFRGYIVTSDGSIYYSVSKTRNVKQIMNANIDMLPENKEKEKITIMLVIGQSNAEGAGYVEERGIVAAANGKWELSAKPTTTKYGQVFMTTSKTPVTKLGPENEYSVNYVDVKGGFAPAFAAKWNELTGEKVVILQLALGATSLAEWQKDANTPGLYKELNFTQYNGSTNPSGNRGYNSTDGYYLYSRAVKTYNETYTALSKQYEISHSFYLWNQGESNENRNADTNTIYGDELYAEYFEKMHNDLLNDCYGMTMGNIIAVRCCRAAENSKGIVISGATNGPRRAQYRISAKRDDVNTVSWLTESCNGYESYWSKVPEGMLYGKDHDLVPSYKGCSYAYSNMHYSQLKYNEMGAEGAENLYKILYGEAGFDGVAVRDANGDLIGKFGTDGSGEFVLQNDNTVGTRYLQIRPEDASCTYDFSLGIDKETSTLKITVYADGSHHNSGDEYIDQYGEINWSALGSDKLNIICEIIK